MSKITLTRKQAEKFIQIYEHFREINCFHLEIVDKEMIRVSFDLFEPSETEEEDSEQ
jgi:hypothetical protein